MRPWGGAIVVAGLLMLHRTAASEQPVHEVQIVASKFMCEPSTIQVTAGEPVRLVVRSKEGTHGFSIPKLKVDVVVPKTGDAVTMELTATAGGPLRDRVLRILWQRPWPDEGRADQRRRRHDDHSLKLF